MKSLLLTIYILAMFVSLGIPSFVNAQNSRPGLKDSGVFLNQAVAETGVRTDDVNSISGSIINRALQLVGLAFLILMIYGGIVWMTARGNEERVVKAKNTIKGAIVGLVLVVAAYGIVYFATNAVLGGNSDVLKE